MTKQIKSVFIARRFPPSIGGMQQFAYDLSSALPEQGIALTKVTWGGSSRLTLPFVLPWLFIRGLWKLLTDLSIQAIHMQDAVLSPIGWLLSRLTGRPWIVIAHGLDLTFKLGFYQKVNVFFARRCDAMIAISQATADEATKRGIAPEKITVIPLGVKEELLVTVDRSTMVSSIGADQGSMILLTVGRLAKRKGVTWFIANVLPKLDENVHYVVIGDGVERDSIAQEIKKRNLGSRVHILGAVDTKTKQQWLACADIFVMPNVKVIGDMEGFGIVAHEAALAELPVVASNLEGITEALQDGKSGILLPEKNAAKYARTITELLSDEKQRKVFGRRAREYTLKTFGWPKIAAKYRAVYEKVIS